MKTKEAQRQVFNCLSCGHKFVQRRPSSVQHRCGRCGSSSTVTESDLDLASLALKPWAYLCSGMFPPLPLPHEALQLPVALLTYGHIMGQANQPDARKQAIRIMLGKAGFSDEQIENLVQRFSEK